MEAVEVPVQEADGVASLDHESSGLCMNTDRLQCAVEGFT
jgi:hypothetical protein